MHITADGRRSQNISGRKKTIIFSFAEIGAEVGAFGPESKKDVFKMSSAHAKKYEAVL